MPGLEWVEETFENLHPDDYFKTSEATSSYNCIAFAGGDVTRRWDPSFYWHKKAVKSRLYQAIESFYYHEKQYCRCDDGELEDGYEKVAIYADDRQFWKHAARLRSDGWWESKLGIGEDIRHRTVECLEGEEYGRVVQYMKRKLDGDEECHPETTKEEKRTDGEQAT